MLDLFEVETLEQLVGELKEERLEAYDENNISIFYHMLTAQEAKGVRSLILLSKLILFYEESRHDLYQ